VPVPKPLADATAEVVTRLPLLPDSVAWIHSVKKPVLMKTERARRELGWRPKHSAKAVLRETIAAERAETAAR
jgi:UDP-glucose 4-epimerase